MPTNPKWQIGLFLWLKPYRGGAGTAGGAGAKSETLFARSPSGVQGGPPDTPLVTFVVKRKSPGCRAWLCHALAERLHQGWSAEEGPSPPRISGHAGAPRPCKKSPPGSRSPLYLYPETNKKLHPNVQPRKGKIKKGEPPPLAFLPALCYTLFKNLNKY